MNLAKYHIYVKLTIDGVASDPFSAVTLEPPAARNSKIPSRKSSGHRASATGHAAKSLKKDYSLERDGGEFGERQIMIFPNKHREEENHPAIISLVVSTDDAR